MRSGARRTARGGAYVPRRAAFYLWDISRPGAGMPPAAPFLSAAKEMGENAAKSPRRLDFLSPLATAKKRKVKIKIAKDMEKF